MKKCVASQATCKKVPPNTIFFENILSLVFARNAQQVGFRGGPKKWAPINNLPKVCAPQWRLAKKGPPQNVRTQAIKIEQSLIYGIGMQNLVLNIFAPKHQKILQRNFLAITFLKVTFLLTKLYTPTLYDQYFNLNFL